MLVIWAPTAGNVSEGLNALVKSFPVGCILGGFEHAQPSRFERELFPPTRCERTVTSGPCDSCAAAASR